MLNSSPYGVMFHHFHSATYYRGQGSIDAEQLAALLAGLPGLLSADAWLARAGRGALQPGDACLTFDDTLRCQYDVALPVLEAHGVTAFWFITSAVLAGEMLAVELQRYFRHSYFERVEDFYTAFLAQVSADIDLAPHRAAFQQAGYLHAWDFYTEADRWFRYVRNEVLSPAAYEAIIDAMLAAYGVDVPAVQAKLMMSHEHVRALHAAGHVIGMHSHTHPLQLSALSPEAQRAEYATCAAMLQDITGEAPRSMSHPVNSYNAHTLTILAELGVQVGFCSHMAVPGDGLLEMPRMDHVALIKAQHSA